MTAVANRSAMRLIRGPLFLGTKATKTKPVVSEGVAMDSKPSDQESAMAVRVAWMRLMGMPEDEIAECCDPQLYPANLAEELKELEAMKRIKSRNQSWSQSRRPQNS